MTPADERAARHIPCALCPTIDGVRPLATVRAWVVTTRREDGQDRAVRYALCKGCFDEAIVHGDVVPGTTVEVVK
jgi:hypothetical protein